MFKFLFIAICFLLYGIRESSIFCLLSSLMFFYIAYCEHKDDKKIEARKALEKKKEDEKLERENKEYRKQKALEYEERLKINRILAPLFGKYGFDIMYTFGRHEPQYMEVCIDDEFVDIYEWYKELRTDLNHGYNKLYQVKALLKENWRGN